MRHHAVYAGGLAGYQFSGTASSNYVSNCTVTGVGDCIIGGLFGGGGSSARVSACYVLSSTVKGENYVSPFGETGFIAGSLVGANNARISACYAGGQDYTISLKGTGSGTVTNSYYQAATTQDDDDDTDDVGARTASELKAPTGYSTPSNNIYKDWNVDLDGQTGGDDPWDFGTGSDYPKLKVDFNRDNAATVAEFGDQS